mmetsp:Transcript_12894/g.17279  ORF Transcript_12894/g.17279 Transcript_12894/m.17279 type:complete len:157 (-) Transcript_12894:273-743(-)|eukprot:CAMPEP_0197290756 /NCGR_PEP_ID=MMETSP0890-20130614/9832_1 /TAXON_ID=44058 ORGANISM="Aureoumbra lagunensis, Strain CCMP1510" /NCGR_SAMPLE_ID=MMETSP0890 /ASSEMBLY_ACC=CAM_ASM_000533 /LENGTH=156 /DNA_ID=CAMNT_0042763007 /DNA_START=74 /DNA_END=547 /DNA_ORIENTATION=-
MFKITKRILSSSRNIYASLSAEYRKSSLNALTKAPVTSLLGVSGEFAEKTKLKSIDAFAKWKYFLWARSLVTLAAMEISGEESAIALNIDNCVDLEHENKSFREIVALPPSALQGLTTKHDDILSSLHIMTIRDLGNWDAAKCADAITILAALEKE